MKNFFAAVGVAGFAALAAVLLGVTLLYVLLGRADFVQTFYGGL